MGAADTETLAGESDRMSKPTRAQPEVKPPLRMATDADWGPGGPPSTDGPFRRLTRYRFVTRPWTGCDFDFGGSDDFELQEEWWPEPEPESRPMTEAEEDEMVVEHVRKIIVGSIRHVSVDRARNEVLACPCYPDRIMRQTDYWWRQVVERARERVRGPKIETPEKKSKI
jgi:hypothetical protein